MIPEFLPGQEYFGLKYAETILEVERLDPAHLNQLNQIRTGELIYSRLWRYNELLQLEGDLLEDVPKPDTYDGREALKCRLKDNLKWPDGHAITIDDIEFSFEYYRKNAKGKKKRLALDTDIVKVDDNTFLLVGNEEGFRYKKRMDIPLLQIIPRHILKGASTFGNSHPYAKVPLGSGPFQLSGKPQKRGSSIEINYHRNVNAIENPANRAERISNVITVTETNTDILIKRMKIGDDESVTEKNDHKGYDLFFQGIRDRASLDELRRELHLDSQRYHSNTVLAIAFNTQNQFVSSIDFRQVIDMVLDDNAIIEKQYGSEMAIDLTGPFNPVIGVIDNTIQDRIGSEIQIIQKLKLQGFIYEPGEDLKWVDPASGKETKVELTMLYSSDYAGVFSPEKKALDDIKRLLMEKYGIEIILDGVDRLSFAKKLKSRSGWDMALVKFDFGWSGNVAPILRSNSRYNYSSYSSPILDQYFVDYTSSDYRKRNEAIKQIHRHCHENLPYLFLWHIRPEVFYRKILRNISITPQYFFTTIGKWEIKGR
jgi:ABC-type transport system substrate-binding protein